MALKPLQVQYISGAHRRMRRLGIYIHIPFCAKKCQYCDFYSVTDPTLMDDYVRALILDFKARKADLADCFVESVYFGGGTPGLLGAKRLSLLLKKLRSVYDFAADAEITLETNPAVLSPEDYVRLHRAGFNRISIGVQSFNDSELSVLGRIHNADKAAEAFQDARKAGFDNINLDLMFGLPGQNEELLRHTLETAVLLNPEHISFYGLKIEPNTPFADIEKDLDLPDDEKYANLYLFGARALEENGYKQYEISNFAKEGYPCRHNLKYWRLYEYVGFGPAAYSYLNFQRYGTPRSLKTYLLAIEQGAPVPRCDEEDIDSAGQLKEYIMMSLRLSEGINRMVYEARFGRSFDMPDRFFKKLQGTGFVAPTETGWRLTPRGFLISNTIIRTLLEFIVEETDKEKKKDKEEQ